MDTIENKYKNHWSRSANAHEVVLKIQEKRSKHPSRYWLDKHHSEETKKKLSDEHKINPNMKRGADHHNWKGGVTVKHNMLRNGLEYATWRNAVYKRDRWTCCNCKIHCENGNIVAHHLESFSDNEELRFSVGNAITLCRACHAKIHTEEKRNTETGRFKSIVA